MVCDEFPHTSAKDKLPTKAECGRSLESLQRNTRVSSFLDNRHIPRGFTSLSQRHHSSIISASPAYRAGINLVVDIVNTSNAAWLATLKRRRRLNLIVSLFPFFSILLVCVCAIQCSRGAPNPCHSCVVCSFQSEQLRTCGTGGERRTPS